MLDGDSKHGAERRVEVVKLAELLLLPQHAKARLQQQVVGSASRVQRRAQPREKALSRRVFERRIPSDDLGLTTPASPSY